MIVQHSIVLVLVFEGERGDAGRVPRFGVIWKPMLIVPQILPYVGGKNRSRRWSSKDHKLYKNLFALQTP